MRSAEAAPSLLLAVGDSESMVREAVAAVDSAALSVVAAADAEAAKEIVRDRDIEYLVSENELPDSSGVALLSALRESHPDIATVVLTQDPAVQSEAISAGATETFVRREMTDEASVLGQRLKNVVAGQQTERCRDDHESRAATVAFLHSVYDVTTDPTLSHETKIDRVLQLGAETLGLSNAFLTRLDIEGDRQTILEARGSHELLQPGESCPLSKAYCRKTIESDGLLAFENAVDAGWVDDPAYEQFQLGCYIGGKVLVDDELYGTLCFASTEPREASFTDLERTSVRLISKWVSYELERKRAREELELAETVFEQAQDAIFLIDVVDESEFRIERVNPAYGELTGLDPDTIRGQTPTEILGPELGGKIEARYRDCVEQGQPIEYEEQLPIAEEPQEWHTKLAPVIEDGQVVKLVGATRDITERKIRERELSTKTNAMDAAPVGILISDPSEPDNPAVYVNDQFTEMTGYPRSEVLGRNCRFLQGEGTEEEPIDTMREAVDNREVVSVELRNYRRDGTEFWNRVTIAPIENAAGELTNYVGFQEDVTERKERELELKLRNRAMAEAPIGITIHDAAEPWPITYANSGFADVTGYEQSAVDGSGLSVLTGAETDQDRFDALESAFERGESITDVLVLYRRDGTPIWGRISIAPVTDDDGTLTHFIVFVQDVTKTKERAEEVERRLDEFGELLADEIRTPLQDAKQTLDAVQDGSADDEITAARQSVELVDTLIDDLATVHSFSVTSRDVFEPTIHDAEGESS